MSAGSIDYKELIARQLEAWPEAARAYAALDKAQTRGLKVWGKEVILQHNPARVRSSAAKIDAQSIAQRGCFLCESARPKEQMKMEVDGYDILVNPYPIFKEHLTIVSRRHEAQRIANRMEDMAEMAYRLPGMTVFYNGARCGASAPDHMHFQAIPSSELPIWRWLESGRMPDKPKYIVCHSVGKAEFMLGQLDKGAHAEPDVNILARAGEEGLDIVIVSRRAHRPSCYGTEGEECVLLSPASVDMGGVWILPREFDFQNLTSKKLEEIIDEVCF